MKSRLSTTTERLGLFALRGLASSVLLIASAGWAKSGRLSWPQIFALALMPTLVMMMAERRIPKARLRPWSVGALIAVLMVLTYGLTYVGAHYIGLLLFQPAGTNVPTITSLGIQLFAQSKPQLLAAGFLLGMGAAIASRLIPRWYNTCFWGALVVSVTVTWSAKAPSGLATALFVFLWCVYLFDSIDRLLQGKPGQSAYWPATHPSYQTPPPSSLSWWKRLLCGGRDMSRAWPWFMSFVWWVQSNYPGPTIWVFIALVMVVSYYNTKHMFSLRDQGLYTHLKPHCEFLLSGRYNRPQDELRYQMMLSHCLYGLMWRDEGRASLQVWVDADIPKRVVQPLQEQELLFVCLAMSRADEAQEALGLLESFSHLSNHPKLRPLYLLARSTALFVVDEHKQARESFQALLDALDKPHTNALAYHYLALIELETEGDPNEAMRLIEKCLSSIPPNASPARNPDYHSVYGAALLASGGAPQEAEELLKGGFLAPAQTSKSLAFTHFYLGLCLEQQDHTEEALRHYHTASLQTACLVQQRAADRWSSLAKEQTSGAHEHQDNAEEPT